VAVTGIVDSIDVSVEVWGGLVNSLAAADLPHGASPDCGDVQFQIGSVKTRPGITSKYAVAGNPTFNYEKTYLNLNETTRFLSLDSLGILRQDVTPGGALAPIYSNIIPGAYCKSDSLFAREYFAFGDGKNGLDIPRQYDDTNFDRLSQVGAGLAPSVSEYVTVSNILTGAGLGLIPNTFAVVGLTTSADGRQVFAHIGNDGFRESKVGDTVKIAGNADGYNGTYVIASIADQYHGVLTSTLGPLPASTTGVLNAQIVGVQLTAPLSYTFAAGTSMTIASATDATYDGTWQLRLASNFGAGNNLLLYIPGNSGTASDHGTLTINGNIPAGVHQVSVIFVTRNKAYLKPAPPISFTSTGKPLIVSQIATGPINIAERILCFTATAQASFYHLGPLGTTIANSNMVIPDNTTTTAIVDFSDAVLLLGTLDDPLFNQIELPPVAGILGYSSRLFAWGEQANVQNFNNLTFDGGFDSSHTVPLGWTLDPTASGIGGRSANALGQPTVFGDAYAITGDGATAIRGMVTQSAAADYLGTPILQPNTAYSVRVRLFRVAPANNGVVKIEVYSPSAGSLGIFAEAVNTLSTLKFQVFSGPLIAAQASIPADAQLRLYVSNTLDATGIVVIDNIEIYPTNQQFNNSNVRASKGQLATQGQESFDGVTGLIEYNLNDGQSVRSMFKIRERLYIVKEHSLGVTQDDGVNEPALWSVNDVSKNVGTPSVNGVGIGEDWVVIAHRTGLYLYWGGEPLSISLEIQPTWDTINWQYGHLISVTVDTRRRRMYVCAPFGASTIPNKTLVLDYHDVGSDASAIASNPPIHLTYTGTKKAFDRARKWTIWTIPANSVAMIELSNGQQGLYFGSNDGSGNINVLDDTGTVFTDNGNAIPSYYVTAAFAELPTEEAKQLRSHRHLYTYLTMFAQGSGTLGMTVFPDSLSNGIALNSQALSNPAFQDLQMMLNQSTERMFIKFASQGVGQNFDMQRMVVNMKPEPWAIIR
jgi:hypothetical protein